MRWLCIVLMWSLSACGFTALYEVPDDLRLVGLKLGEGPYDTSPSNDGIHSEMIDVDIVTNFNYTNYAVIYSVTAKFFFCDQPNIFVQRLSPAMAFRYDRKWKHIGEDGSRELDNGPAPYHYHTGMSSFSRDTIPLYSGRPTILVYDLRKSPRDVCFYLDATAPFGIIGHRKSNIVRISKGYLADFFAKNPPRRKLL